MKRIVTILTMAAVMGMMTVVTAGQQSSGQAAQQGGQQSEQQEKKLVNLNTATAEQLETLPGVGEATAKRILEHRQKIGGFKKIEELMNVRGIGEKTFLTLKPLITVEPPKFEAR